MSNGLLYIAGLVSLALAALFAVPYFVDWNGYRGVFEEEATRILGREVRVGGNVNVRFLPSPYVSFEKLRIADPSGSTGEPLFRAESFTMRLSAPPLLKGVIEANEIVLEKPFVRLAVDSEGGGNWRSLSIAPGSLPFVPTGVTLQSVKINDGTIAMHGPKGIGFAEVGGLNGELKADSIDGPFSFKGTANWADGVREVRIATGATEPSGGIRFKATVRGDSSTASVYAIDGRFDDLKGRPRIDGEITAKLPLPSELAEAGQSEPAATAGAKPEAPLIDFKARVAGDARGLRVDDITLAFEHVGQPQLISGAATATWAEALNIEMNLSSRWLDLDRVTKSEREAPSPFDTARSFIVGALEALPQNADSKVNFDIDQATLGGEAVSGIRLEVVRNQGTLLLNTLRAGLPGGTRVAVDGAVADDAATNGQGKAFRGDITLHGTSLARFLDWAARDKAVAELVRNEGPFSLQGQLAMNDSAVDLTDAGAEIGGRQLTGDVHYTRKGRPRLAVALEGSEIDAAQLWPAGVAAFKGVLAGGDPAQADTKPKFAWLDTATTDLRLQLRTGELITGHGRLRDVDMDVAMDGGRLAVRSCKFSAADNLQVEIDGDVADTLKSPRGALHWVVGAPTKDAYATLVKLFDLSDESRQQIDAFASLAPMRLAASVQLGRRGADAADVSIDGSVQDGGRLILTALLDGGLDNWRTAPADVTASIASPNVDAVMAGLATQDAGARASGAAPQAGEIFLKAVGTPGSGMTATASVKAPSLVVGYDGRITVPEAGGRAIDGELRIAARSLSDALAVAGLGGGAPLSDTPVVGNLKVSSADHAYELKPQGLTIGGSKVDGSFALSYPKDGPAIVTGEIGVDAASVPGLLNLVLDRKQVAEAPGAEPLAQGKSIWPEHAFDFSALDGVEGKLNVTFGALSLADSMQVAKARAVVELAPGKIVVSKLEGKVLEGTLQADVTLDRAPGGAGMKSNVRIADMIVHRPATVPAQAAAASSDSHASLTLQIEGRASTPGALLSVATGKGELQLGDFAAHVPTPLAVVAASDAALSGEAGGSGEQLVAAIRAQIDGTAVKLGPRTIAIDVADGAIKLAAVKLDSDAGSTKVETTVDLASLIVDSAWTLEPRAPDVPQADKPRHGALPSVNVVYTGPLASMWSLDQRITADPLERELAIRKMELDADQLERLHKADAERARREEERRRAVESDESTSAPEDPPTEAGSLPDPPARDSAPSEPVAPQGAATPPVMPPSSASAAGVSVPPAPGQEDQTFGAADPVNTSPLPPAPQAATAPSPSPAYRPRRPQRQLHPGDQVLRNLMNNGN